VTATYPACEQVVLSTTFTDYEQTNSSSVPWVQHSYTYDDYGQYGLQAGYHLLLVDSMTSSNGPTYAKQPHLAVPGHHL
jgi:hypothetical protein